MLTTLPLQHVSIAMVSHRDWRSLFRTNFPGNEYNDTHTYRRHPELWGEFTLDPCGIQILTDLHLAKAHDLSNWRTTRLDPTHHLVEAREPPALVQYSPFWRPSHMTLRCSNVPEGTSARWS